MPVALRLYLPIAPMLGTVGVAPAVGNVPLGMKELGYRYFEDSETWAAKIHRFEEDGSAYVFANDLIRGLDVFKFTPDAPASADGGEWLSAEQVARLRNEFGIYALDTGRICVAALNQRNIDGVIKAIVQVL